MHFVEMAFSQKYRVHVAVFSGLHTTSIFLRGADPRNRVLSIEKYLPIDIYIPRCPTIFHFRKNFFPRDLTYNVEKLVFFDQIPKYRIARYFSTLCTATSSVTSGHQFLSPLSSPSRHCFMSKSIDCVLGIVSRYITHLKIRKYNSVNKTGI